MADTARGGGGASAVRAPTELQIPKKWRHREATATSPERTKVWTEPNSKPSERRVPVVYYLSRNGHLEHPHFMEVPLSSSSDGLYLKDVISRLNLLRGTGMAAMYSWSSKRSYKNGFVWQDLAEHDFIYPSHGNEYVLKGSELLHDAPSSSSSSSRPLESVSFRSPKLTEEQSEDAGFPVITRRRNQSWSSIDLHEYKVYKTESNGESARKPAADASTQTYDKRRRMRRQAREKEIEDACQNQNVTTELSREEISPPPSDSSPETLESLMKADKRLVLAPDSSDGPNPTAVNLPSGRMRASAVLMQLISCGSFSFKDCGATYVKDQGLSLIGHYKSRLPRGTPNDNSAGPSGEVASSARPKLEDKEYFSGSLIETKREEIPTLKRSSSYNADGSSQLQLAEKDVNGIRSKCIPRKLRVQSAKREQNSIAALGTQHLDRAIQELN